jgi:hypothetical protein
MFDARMFNARMISEMVPLHQPAPHFDYWMFFGLGAAVVAVISVAKAATSVSIFALRAVAFSAIALYATHGGAWPMAVVMAVVAGFYIGRTVIDGTRELKRRFTRWRRGSTRFDAKSRKARMFDDSDPPPPKRRPHGYEDLEDGLGNTN